MPAVFATHQAGVLFLLLTVIFFIIYFISGAGAVSTTKKEADKNAWKTILGRIWQICLFLSILSFAELLPASVESWAVGVLRPLFQ